MDFVITANAWSASRDNPTSKHQVALELARQGHRVLWIETAGMRVPRLGAASDRGRILRKAALAVKGAREERAEGGNLKPERRNGSEEMAEGGESCEGVSAADPRGQRRTSGGTPEESSPACLCGSVAGIPESVGRIWVMAPLMIPLPSSAWARRLNGRIVSGLARKWIRKLGFGDDAVLINFMPILPEVMRRWRGRTVYYCVDRWDQFALYDSALMADLDRQCCEAAGVVAASSRDLLERCQRYHPNARLISHGVDYRHFAKALEQEGKKDVATNPHGHSEGEGGFDKGGVIGFVGLISEWVDQDLMVKVAKAFPEATMVCVGKADVPVASLAGQPNIRMIGVRPFRELPGLVAGFDVGIIPFAVNDLTRAVNPIKLREMLAAGCPVVSTALPEAARCAERAEGGVTIARDSAEFVARVRERLEHPLTPDQKRTISRSVKDETWEAKVKELLKLIGEGGREG